MKIDKKIIKELVDYLNEFNLTELEYKDGEPVEFGQPLILIK